MEKAYPPPDELCMGDEHWTTSGVCLSWEKRMRNYYRESSVQEACALANNGTVYDCSVDLSRGPGNNIVQASFPGTWLYYRFYEPERLRNNWTVYMYIL
jgi:hypothetical protein